MKNFRFALALALTAFVPQAFAQDVQPIDGIAAIVDEDVILQSELDRAVRNITAQCSSRPPAPSPPACA